MRIHPVLLPVAAICLVTAHAEEKETPVAVQKEMIASTKKINEQLASINSSASADKAAAEIKILGPEYAKLIERKQKAVSAATPEELKQLEELVKSNEEALNEFDANMKRIMQNQWLTLNLAFALRTMNPKPPEQGKLVPIKRTGAKP